MTNEDKKKKNAAFIKSNIELLEYAKKNMKERGKNSPEKEAELEKQLDDLKQAEIERAVSVHGISAEELSDVKYKEPTTEEVNRYKEMLKKMGVTEEEVANRTFDPNNAVKKKKGKKNETNIKEESKKTVFQSLLGKIKPSKKEESTTTSQPKEGQKDTTEEQVVEEMPIMQPVVYTEEVKEEIKDNSLSCICEPFDTRLIPQNVQYDIIPLPSEGQCYPIDSPLRVGRIAVAYLTAADENIITSPNMYANGDLIDVILERKILDKRIKVSDLCNGDRDAVTLWLRATGYGTEFPVVARHPETGKEYKTTIDLEDLKYLPYKYKSDDKGHFTYKNKKGDVISYKILTYKDIVDIAKEDVRKREANTISTIKYKIDEIGSLLNDVKFEGEEDEENKTLLTAACDCVREWCDKKNEEDNVSDNEIYQTLITRQMETMIYSINGNTNRDFISQYVNNMRAFEAREFREHSFKRTPGVNLEITIDIPESDGGGSFNTFLRISDNVFINI